MQLFGLRSKCGLDFAYHTPTSPSVTIERARARFLFNTIPEKMNLHKNPLCKTLFALLISSVFCTVSAQESAYADLDSCVKSEQIASTAKGAALGALTGLGASLFGGKKDDTAKNVVIGAAIGGAAGFAKAYYTATEICFKKNPSWLPASQIQRTKSFDQLKKDARYKPGEGIRVEAKRIDIASSVKAGTATLPIDITYFVLTPNDAETRVTIERKLFIVENSGETSIPFPGTSTEERTMEPGEFKEHFDLLLSSAMPVGTKLKFETIIKGPNTKPSSISGVVTIQ